MSRNLAFDLAVAERMSERELEDQVRDACKKFRLLRYHTYRATKSPAGFPDEVIVGSNGTLFRELKRQSEKPTVAQQEWLDGLAAAGQDAAVWRPADWMSGRIIRELFAISTRR